jgi:phosphate transport system substrate-binding protein
MMALVAEAYEQETKDPVPVELSFSGTGGGFAKFCAGETDINNASRPILEAEIQACDQSDVRFVELPIAMDALTVAVHPENDWANDITVEELRQIWSPAAQRTVVTWQDIRPEWPDEEIVLFGPGTDSGTYDYFAEVIIGDGQETRSDYTASEDDDLLVRGITNEPNALGYFGLAYYEANPDEVKPLAIDGGNGPVAPSAATVVQAEYNPLGRPLFIYVNLKYAQYNRHLREFVDFALTTAPTAASAVGYVALPDEAYHISSVNFQEGDAGTAFDGKPQPNITIAELLRREKRVE